MKTHIRLVGTLVLLAILVFQVAPANADNVGPSTISAASDCRASGQGEIPPLSSQAVSFTCSSETTVYFGVCDSGSLPNDDLFNITYLGGVVAYNEYVDGQERTHIGKATVSAGSHQATLNSLNDTPYPPTTYSYAISPDSGEVNGYLSTWCGEPDGRARGGSIRGLVFVDSNRNGALDPGERGIAGVSVTLYSSGDWHHTFTSGLDGTYAPVALDTSYYAVQLTVPPGYAATGPTRYQGIWIDANAGTVVLGIDFPIAPAALYSYPPTPSNPPSTSVIHVVRRGEWLYKIARAYHVNVWEIVAANHLSSLQLVPEQRLIIPGVAPTMTAASPTFSSCRQTYVVQPGNNLFRISLWYGIPLHTLASHNGIRYPYTVYVGQRLCIP